jgi:hypothetical protein
MDFIAAALSVATIVSFAVDVQAILKGDRKRAIVLLSFSGILTVALVLQTFYSARVQAENRLLTNTQERAARLIETWNNTSEGFDQDFMSTGEAEGIVAAAADLMEDSKECRPEAFRSARDRSIEARRRDAALGEELHDSLQRLDISQRRSEIWEEASAAAYQQVLGVSRVPPNC